MSQLLDRLNFLTSLRKGTFADGHGQSSICRIASFRDVRSRFSLCCLRPSGSVRLTTAS